MTEFELYFSFYGLLLGLSVAAVVTGLAAALSSRQSVEIGWLTALLALFVLLDISSFWIFAWRARDFFDISFATIYLWLAVAVAYFLSASLVFPRVLEGWKSLDEYYWSHKRLVLPGIMFANAVAYAHGLVVRGDEMFRGPQSILIQAAYWIPLIALFVSKSPLANRALLVWMILFYAVGAVVFRW